MQFSKWVTLGFGALCLVAVAGVLNASHLYYMAAILLTLPGVSWTLGWNALRGLSFRRELPPTAWEGEDGEIVYVAENRSKVSRFFLSIQEPLPAWIVSLEPETPLFNAAAEDVSTVSHRVHFLRRGVYRVAAFDVSAMDPLGVFAFTRHVASEGELVVYPLPQQMRRLDLSGADRYGWQEFTSVLLRGSSVDPDGVRRYTPGDPLRRIHWRQTARTGKLSVIEFEESQSINLVVALDLHKGTEVGKGTETTLEYAVRLAASACYQAIQQGAGASLILPPAESEVDQASFAVASVQGRGESHLFLLLDALARVQATATESLGDVLRSSLSRLAAGTTLLVLTSSPEPSLADSLALYTASGANVVVVYIDPESFEGGKRHVSAKAEENLFAELLAVRAHPFILRSNPEGNLFPEAIAHVHA